MVRENDNFDIAIIEPKEIKYLAEDIKLNIIYEDDDLIVIDKQAGIETHTSKVNKNGKIFLFHNNYQSNYREVHQKLSVHLD